MFVVQSLSTTDEQISKMMDQLTRRDDALVQTFLAVLELDDQKHVSDFILSPRNAAGEDAVIQQQFRSVQQQDMSAAQVTADADDGLNCCEDSSETEVKKLNLADQAFAVRDHSAGSVRNRLPGEVNLLDDQVDMDRSGEISQTEVKNVVDDRVCSGPRSRGFYEHVTRFSELGLSSTAATRTNALDSVVCADCCSVQDGNSLVSETACKLVDDGDVLMSETACKVAGTSAQAGSIALVSDVVEVSRELIAHDGPQSTRPKVTITIIITIILLVCTTNVPKIKTVQITNTIKLFTLSLNAVL